MSTVSVTLAGVGGVAASIGQELICENRIRELSPNVKLLLDSGKPEIGLGATCMRHRIAELLGHSRINPRLVKSL